MSIYRHFPDPPLGQYVDWFWYYAGYFPDHDRQHVLPDGTFELVINLQTEPRKLFERTDTTRHRAFKRGWLSGAQSEYLVIDALPGSSMIGVHFKPGGAAPFLGLPAGELAGQVVELDAVWGDGIWEWRDRLLSARGAVAKFQVLEQFLRLRMSQEARPTEAREGLRWAIQRFVREPQVPAIGGVIENLGISHKHFIDQFRREVGLTPKLFCRIRRFQEVLGQIHSQASVDWADVAFSGGYFDQAHFVNDFTAFAGLNPTRYLRHRIESDRDFRSYIRAAESRAGR